MADPHIIRLNGPWELSVNSDKSVRVKFPAGWEELCNQFQNKEFDLTRFFNRPTGIDSGETISLVIEHLIAAGKIQFNDQVLSELNQESEILSFNITSQIKLRNEIVLQLSELKLALHKLPEIRLEIN